MIERIENVYAGNIFASIAHHLLGVYEGCTRVMRNKPTKEDMAIVGIFCSRKPRMTERMLMERPSEAPHASS